MELKTLELKEYLGMIIDVEKNLEIQRKAYDKLKSKLKLCNDEKEKFNNELARVIAPKAPKDTFGSILVSILAWIFVFAVTFAVSTFILFIILAEDVGKGVPFTALLSLAIVIYNVMGLRKDDRRNYQKNLEKYNELINNKKLNISASEVKIEYLTKQIEKIKEIISNSEKNLKMLYDNDFIHPKYKRLDYVVLIYECLDTGRCDKLEGPDGAYNKVELDHRLDNISSKLGMMINSLGDIRGILNGMREDINRMADWLQSVNNSITVKNQNIENGNEPFKQIEAESKLNEYQQERTARELEYANRIDYLKGKNNM